MARERRDANASLEIPDLGGSITAPSDEARPVWRDADGCDAHLVTIERADAFPGDKVPDLGGLGQCIVDEKLPDRLDQSWPM